MSGHVYPLLKGYLRRTLGMWVILGLAQCLLTKAYWGLHIDRAPLLGALLGSMGAMTALNSSNLVWRVVPLTARDATLFRWLAIAGAPGLLLTLCTAFAWISNQQRGWSVPPLAVSAESVAAIWAVLGLFAALPPRALGNWSSPPRARTVLILVATAISFAYGLPLAAAVGFRSTQSPGDFPEAYVSLTAIAAGIVLLMISASRALRGSGWTWPDLSGARHATAPTRSASESGLYSVPSDRSPVRPERVVQSPRHSGWIVLFGPLVRQTAILAVAATGFISALYRLFPNGTLVLLWVYLVGVSLAGALLTRNWRTAIQPLRCLPMSANRLALILQAARIFPSGITFCLTLAAHRIFPATTLDMPVVVLLAFIASQAIFDLQDRQIRSAANVANRYGYRWLELLQPLSAPLWLGSLFSFSASRDAPPWLAWLMLAFALVPSVANHLSLLSELRVGTRPSTYGATRWNSVPGP